MPFAPEPIPTKRLMAATLLCLLAAACGGGGGGDAATPSPPSIAPAPPSPTPPPPPPPPALGVSGSAAAGLPLQGTVSVKDATGTVRTATIGALGAYVVDVAGLTAPLVLRAEGTAGSTPYVIHAAIASVPSSRVVNITPLTDLIVANAVGQSANTYFDGGSFATLDAARLQQEADALKAKLLPVLQAVGVDANADLMSTPFTPLSSPIDRALDALRVTVDPVTQVATITNVVNEAVLQDDLTRPASQDGTTPPLSGIGTAALNDELPAIRQVFAQLTALFANGSPSATSVRGLLSAGFLNNDTPGDAMAAGLAADGNLVGAVFDNVALIDLDLAAAGGAQALVEFTVRVGGNVLNRPRWLMQKAGDGTWRLHGDQRVLDVELRALMVRDLTPGGCMASGFELLVRDADPSNSNAIHHVRLTGPGLPTAGLRYQRSAGNWVFEGFPQNPFWYRLTSNCGAGLGAGVSDATIAAIPSPATYTLRAYNASGQAVNLGSVASYGVNLSRRPATLAELLVATFPTYNTSVDLVTYSGGPITISGLSGYPGQKVWTYIGLTGSGAVRSVEQEAFTASDGSYGVTLNLASGTTLKREIRVAGTDASGRAFMSFRGY